MEKRLRGLSALLIFALLGVTAWALSMRSQRDQIALMMGTRYQQAFQELVDGVDRMEANLAKVSLAGAPSDQIPLLTEIWRDAGLAQAGVGQIPLPVGRMMRTSTFLAQAGDYAYSLVRQAARGVMPDDRARERLAALNREASQLAAELHGIFDKAQAGPTGWIEIQRAAARGLTPPRTNVVGDGLQQVEVQLEEVPTLTYDGPFSDHMTERKPRGLQGEEIGPGEAERVARAFVPSPERDRYQVAVTDRVQGPMPAYHVAVRPPKGGGATYTLDVARQGGAVVWMSSSRQVGSGEMDRDEMRRRAETFARERMPGVPLEAVDSVAAQGRTTFSLIPRVDDVLIYPDMVKVTVAADNGEILHYDAQSYLMNHTDRRLGKPELSEQEARRRLPPDFEPDGPGRLALIPTDSLREVLTYEYRGRVGSQRFILFLNADSGDTEEILQVVPSSEGEVTR
ncbi:germination protein YpeB [Limnochorda pilosa]|uniref:Germination protein YpeB n=1 Tax=Limnochorda pilosa TaxID=1555112 RepID=A0A0K2SNG5_LIMPI|nr:germination protein YpeB [Limnochorda pilosa]BAS28379.1 germination protein YpeB [Limnochorda pilosa]